MVDLSKSATDTHWRDQSNQLYALLSAMDGKDTWALDDKPAIRDAMEEWSSNYSMSIGQQAKHQPDDFLRFLAFIRSTLSLRVLEELENKSPGATSDLIYECVKADESSDEDRRHQQIFRDRVIAVSQTGALDRIFSEERLAEVSKLINETAKFYGIVYETK